MPDTDATPDPEDHLEAAENIVFDDVKPDAKPDDKKAADKKAADVEKKPSVLDSVLKTKAAPADDQTEVADTSDLDALEAPDESSKSFSGWKELKEKAKADRAEAFELRQKLSSLEAKASDDATKVKVDDATELRLKELEETNKTLSDRLKSSDIKSHPEFEEKFLKPEKAARERLQKIIEDDELSDVQLDELLSLKGRKFNQELSDISERLTPLARVRFIAQIDAITETRAAAEEALADSDAFTSTANERSGVERKASFDRVSASYEGSILPRTAADDASDEEKASVESWNTSLAGVRETAEKALFGATDNDAISGMAIKAGMSEFMVEHVIPHIGAVADREIATRDTRIGELEGELKRLTDADPAIKPSSGGGGDTAPAESHLEAAGQVDWGSQ
tara:strand:- start:2955 stop:4142 length:1188 start_codon:yes stop_codon:yes gene_type:complete